MSLKPKDVENSDTSDLSQSEQDTLDEWFLKFSSKYEKVGTLVVWNKLMHYGISKIKPIPYGILNQRQEL